MVRGGPGRAAGVERRQVFDMPEAAVAVTEHQLIERECGCGQRTRAAAPPGAEGPVQYGPRIAARLARLHARVADVRADALHKATTELTRRYQTLVVEDLNVAAMIRNRHLARHRRPGLRQRPAHARLQIHVERRPT